MIWVEPLIVPLGSCELPLITPLGSDEITCAEDDIVPLGISVWEPLVNPNAVICAEPLIVPAGTVPLPVGMVTVFPSDIVSWSPLIESDWVSEPVLSVAFSKVSNLESTEDENEVNVEPLIIPLGSWSTIEPLKIPLPSVICVDDETNPLGLPLNPLKVIWDEPLTVPLGK